MRQMFPCDMGPGPDRRPRTVRLRPPRPVCASRRARADGHGGRDHRHRRQRAGTARRGRCRLCGDGPADQAHESLR
ncbi:MAG: hypothetical protein MZU91_01160 [Desulfosudis oleivorans]|nr:hypothetical protein [Desulfosudis oleivorans]